MKQGKYLANKAQKPSRTPAAQGEGNNAENTAPAQKQMTSEQNLLLYFRDIIYLFAAVLLVFSMIFRIVVVSGSSMYNTLIDGDYILLISNVFYRDVKQGDIIVASKDSFRDGEPIVKRVIATEGQTVDIDFNAGVVYVDGVALEESYTYTATTVQEGITFPLTVEEGCVFVMGDNRAISLDSRNPAIGMVDEREVMGKAIFLVLPGIDEGETNREFSRIGAL